MNKLLRILCMLAAPALVQMVSSTAVGQTLAEDFEDGSLSPFTVESIAGNVSEIITPVGFNARAGTKVHHIKWYADNYNGARSGRSVEGTSGSGTRITSEGWYGFSFYAPASFPVPGKNMVLGQIIAWHSSLPNTNITITVGVEATGRFILEGAYGVGDGGKTTTVYTSLSPQLTKGTWHDVIIYCKFARNNTGVLRAWLDGAPESAPTANFTGINLGNGGWTNDTTMTYGGYIKWGPYCWDYSNYTAGESREIYYDEIAYQVGNPTGAFDIVKPTGYGTGYALPAQGTTVMAETFDAMTTGAQPTGMTIVKGAGTALTVREIPSATDKCMQFYDPSATGRAEATKTFSAQNSRFNAGWSFRQNGQGEGHCMALLSGGVSAIELYTIGGNLVYRDGTGADIVLQAVPANSWYDIDVDINPLTQKADVYVGGVRKLTAGSFRNAATSVDRIRFGTSDVSDTWHLYINDVTINQSPIVFNETFNSLVTGSAPTGWQRESGTSLTVREVPSATDKSMQFYDGSATTKGEAWNTFVQRNSGKFAASWAFKQTGQAEGHRMALLAGTTGTAVELFTIGGNLVYRNGSGTDVTVQAIPANVWYNVKTVVRLSTGTVDVYVNDVLKLSGQTLRSAVTSVDRVLFSTSDVSALYHLYIDNVVVTEAGVP